MLLTEYLQDFTKAIDEYSITGCIITSELKIDARTEKIGLIKATIDSYEFTLRIHLSHC